jgi:NitT/TauT family transport system substrate-binding protein
MASFPRWLTGSVAAGLIVAACSSAATPAPTAAPSKAPASAAASVAPTATPLPGTKKFSIGFTSAGISSAPMMAALDALSEKGYNIDRVIVDSSELVTQGVATGQFAFGSGANNSVMAAIEKGANLRLVISRVKNEWSMYAPKSVTTCAGLDGKKLALHSEGAVSTAMVKNWVNTKCPGTKPNYVIIAGSDNRVAALLANQIDASPVELGDAVTLDLKAADRYALLSNFGADLPDLQVTSIYVNTEWAAANPGSVVAVIKAVLAQYKKIDGNAAYLKEISQKFVPNSLNKDTVDAAVKKYVDLKMFPTDGGLTDANLAYTAKFFGPAPDGTGSTAKLLGVSAFADSTFLKLALGQIK